MSFACCIAPLLALVAAQPDSTATHEQLVSQVRDAEIAFARTMALRDHHAFATYVSEEALFFGGQGVLRGTNGVATAWKKCG